MTTEWQSTGRRSDPIPTYQQFLCWTSSRRYVVATFTGTEWKDDSGNVSERKYKLNTPIVRRVLAPGEQLSKLAPKKKRRS